METTLIRDRDIQAGAVVFVQGYEFTVSNPRFETNPDGRRVFRFDGACSADPRNDGIRHTAYNGGTYGGLAGRSYESRA